MPRHPKIRRRLTRKQNPLLATMIRQHDSALNRRQSDFGPICLVRKGESFLPHRVKPFRHGFAEIARLARSWAAESRLACRTHRCRLTHADSILKPHHTTAMAATMQAAVRARSRTWTFIVSIPFLHYPARTVCDSTICRQLWGCRKNGHRGSPGDRAGAWAEDRSFPRAMSGRSGTADPRKAHNPRRAKWLRWNS